jgi:hypothetical protein
MAARAVVIPHGNRVALNRPADDYYQVADPVTDPLANPITQIGAVTQYVPAAGPVPARANLGALGLTADATALLEPVALGAPDEMDQWQSAMRNAQLGTQYIQNSNFIAGKANTFREIAVIRLREIYGRLLSISARAGNAGAATAAAQAALVELINAVNSQGYIQPQQAQAMADLAEQLNQINIPQMMAGVVGEINDIAAAVGVLRNEDRVGDDAGSIPLVGGRKKKAKNTRKKQAKKTRKKKKTTHKTQETQETQTNKETSEETSLKSFSCNLSL